MSKLRKAALSLIGAVAARGLLTGLSARPPGGDEMWQRTNFRGRTVPLMAGPAMAGAVAVSAAAGAGSAPLAGAALLAGGGAGACGLYDDVVGNRPDQKAYKGLSGHVRALREGTVSSGLVKLVGLTSVGLVAARAVTRKPVDTLITGGIIAGSANLVNLLDLRPGRAIKANMIASLPLLAGPAGSLVAGPLGASGAILPDDLGERVMLGDAGANALGAVLGLRLAMKGGPRWRIGVLAVLVAATAVSEKVSFSKVIASTPGLRQLDDLGRERSSGTG